MARSITGNGQLVVGIMGTDCLAAVGTTGESPTLDHDEHERVIAAVMSGRGRIKVMAARVPAARGRPSLTRSARRSGADGASWWDLNSKPTRKDYRHLPPSPGP